MRRTALLATVLVVLGGVFAASALRAACPTASRITEMRSTLKGFVDAGPYDIRTVKSARAFVLDGGKRIKICLANIDLKSYLSVDALGAKGPKQKGDFALIVQLNNGPNPVVAGKYSPKAGYGKPFWATAEILTSAGKTGTFVSIGASDGIAEVAEIRGTTICGRFDLTGSTGRVSGEFIAELVK